MSLRWWPLFVTITRRVRCWRDGHLWMLRIEDRDVRRRRPARMFLECRRCLTTTRGWTAVPAPKHG